MAKYQLLEHTCGQATQEYWSNKSRFCRMDIKSIDWMTIQMVVTGMLSNEDGPPNSPQGSVPLDK